MRTVLLAQLLVIAPLGATELPMTLTVEWSTPIGWTAGPPVVAGDRVLVGTDNRNPRDPKLLGDHGVMMVFRFANGAFLGQLSHARLDHRSNDLNASIMSRPHVVKNCVYYNNNRGQLVCVDLTAFDAKPEREKIVWSLDFLRDLNVYKRDASDIRNPLPSPIVAGERVFTLTGNGSTFGIARDTLPMNTSFVPRPNAPSFVAVNRATGETVWSSAAPGKDIQYGQWASPALAKVCDTDQVLFPGGDGRLYGFEAKSGKLVWQVDCNPPSATRWDGGRLGTRVSFVAAPVVRKGMAYIGTAIDLERTDVPRPILAIDITRKGDATREAIRWRFHDADFGGTFGQVALGERTLYALGGSGELVCLNLADGKPLWRQALGGDARHFAAPIVVDGRVFVAAGRKLFVFKDAPACALLAEHRFKEVVTATPAVHANALLIATKGTLHKMSMSSKR